MWPEPSGEGTGAGVRSGSGAGPCRRGQDSRFSLSDTESHEMSIRCNAERCLATVQERDGRGRAGVNSEGCLQWVWRYISAVSRLLSDLLQVLPAPESLTGFCLP